MQVAGIRIIRPMMQSCMVLPHRNPAELHRCFKEFFMIHHLARAFHVRETLLADAALSHATEPSSSEQPSRTIKPRPLTPWRAPSRPAPTDAADQATSSTVRISSDPSDVRRTVMSGRFAEVCAALERLVREQEASAA